MHSFSLFFFTRIAPSNIQQGQKKIGKKIMFFSLNFFSHNFFGSCPKKNVPYFCFPYFHKVGQKSGKRKPNIVPFSRQQIVLYHTNMISKEFLIKCDLNMQEKCSPIYFSPILFAGLLEKIIPYSSPLISPIFQFSPPIFVIPIFFDLDELRKR